ncbi:MAG: adenylate/guanylate cyclase domain-containing protein [Bacteroidota bacterium]
MKKLNNHIVLTLIALFSTNVYFLIWLLIDVKIIRTQLITQLSFYEFMMITNGALLVISIFSITYKKLGDILLMNGYSNRFRFFFKVFLSVIIFVLASVVLFAIHFSINPTASVLGSVQNVVSSSYFIALVIFFSFTSMLMFFISNLERRSGNIATLFFRSMGEIIQPKLIQRGFIFIDLNNATSLAEKLGSERYAKLLRDCFRLLNELVAVSNFEVYQYVGDEAVITWKAHHPNADVKALQLFSDFKAYLSENEASFLQEYQILPNFKCAIHFGDVVMSEIGKDIKHLVYHGDVLNTASRLLSKCHYYQTDCIISAAAIQHKEKIEFHYKLNAIYASNLKGKEKQVHAFTVQTIQKNNYSQQNYFFKQK